MTFSEFINKLTQEQVENWWENHVPTIDKVKAEKDHWKYRLEKNGQSLPVKERIAIENELQQKRQKLMKYSNVVQDKIRSKQQEITLRALEPAETLYRTPKTEIYKWYPNRCH